MSERNTRETSRSCQSKIKLHLENLFLKTLNENIPPHILKIKDNVPLIKDEKQMKLAPLYSPACDIAIGPFAFARGSLNNIYERLVRLRVFRDFIEELQHSSLGDGFNEHLLDLNRNPRCFIAMEVENSTASDMKHFLGSVINCSLLGKIGVVVVFNEKMEYAGRLIGYLAFVKRVEKCEKNLFRNVFVISKDDMYNMLGINQ